MHGFLQFFSLPWGARNTCDKQSDGRRALGFVFTSCVFLFCSKRIPYRGRHSILIFHISLFPSVRATSALLAWLASFFPLFFSVPLQRSFLPSLSPRRPLNPSPPPSLSLPSIPFPLLLLSLPFTLLHFSPASRPEWGGREWKDGSFECYFFYSVSFSLFFRSPPPALRGGKSRQEKGALIFTAYHRDLCRFFYSISFVSPLHSESFKRIFFFIPMLEILYLYVTCFFFLFFFFLLSCY